MKLNTHSTWAAARGRDKKNVAMDARAGSSIHLASHHATHYKVLLHYKVTLPLLSGNVWDTLGKLLIA